MSTATKTKTDRYAELTDTIIELIEAQGDVPWRKTWSASNWPLNVDLRPYNGINVFLLAATAAARGYARPVWVTFNGAKAQGGMVRKGERAARIYFYSIVEDKDRVGADGKPKRIPFLRTFSVFNVAQCDGLDELTARYDARMAILPVNDPTDTTAAEALIAGYLTREGIRLDPSGNPCYLPALDTIRCWTADRFENRGEWADAMFHEMTHSTGAASRLSRPGITDLKADKTTPDYSREELTAEMGAAFLCSHAGIDTPARDVNHAAYLAGWLRALREDPRALMVAAGAAGKAVRFITGETAPAAEDDSEG